MREIKFRGLYEEADFSYFVYGSLIVENKLTSIMSFDEPGASTCHTVEPETVGQYTGIKDKNGREIFEGDLIRCDRYPFYGIAPGMESYKGKCIDPNYIGEIFYCAEDCCFYYDLHVISKRVSGRAVGGALFDLSDEKTIEVIGNIHENEDLLDE